MANIDDLYEILGLGADASFDVIRAACRQLALQMHPDIAGRGTRRRASRGYSQGPAISDLWNHPTVDPMVRTNTMSAWCLHK